jgi:hypothetical protein
MLVLVDLVYGVWMLLLLTIMRRIKHSKKQHRDSKWLSQQDRAGIIFSALQQLEARNTRYRNSPDLVETSELFVNVRIAITGEWANLYRPHLPSTIANVKVPREC